MRQKGLFIKFSLPSQPWNRDRQPADHSLAIILLIDLCILYLDSWMFSAQIINIIPTNFASSSLGRWINRYKNKSLAISFLHREDLQELRITDVKVNQDISWQRTLSQTRPQWQSPGSRASPPPPPRAPRWWQTLHRVSSKILITSLRGVEETFHFKVFREF